MLRIYTRVLAVVLALIGVAALAGIFGLGPGAGVLYLISAGIVAYAGSSAREPGIVRTVVGGMGLLFWISGLLLAVIMGALGFPYEGRFWEVGLWHAALGALSVSCAVLLPCADE
jgi:hypothetical protein